MKVSRALVLGGAGFIGSHLTEALIADGVEVTVLDDLSVAKGDTVPGRAAFVLACVGDTAAGRAAADGCEVVFHLAAKVSIRHSIKTFIEDARINLMGTLGAIKGSSEAGAKKFIFASSMAVYDDSPSPSPISEEYPTDPVSPYGLSKLAAERYCLLLAESLGLETVILRYFNTYGRGQTFTPYVGVITIFINQLLSGRSPTIFGDGEQQRDFIHVSDVVNATLLAMRADCPGEVFNVGTGSATSINRIAALLADRIRPGQAPQYTEPAEGELRYSVADITKARRLLGFDPAVTIESRLNEVIEWNRRA